MKRQFKNLGVTLMGIAHIWSHKLYNLITVYDLIDS